MSWERKYLSDRELYPEQFEDLPEDAAPAPRKRAVRLSEIDAVVDGDFENAVKDAVNRRKKPFESKKDQLLKNGVITAAELERKIIESPNTDQKIVDKAELKKKKLSSSEIESEQVDFMAESAETESKDATAYAMRLVSVGSVTERKLRDKLKGRGYSENASEDAVCYVKKFGYINDARVAQDSIEKLAARCWGKYKICRYLVGKGIDEDVIEGLDFSETDFPSHCARLIKKYPAERRDAMLRAVKNAGYTTADFREAMRIIKEENEE